MAQNVSPRKVVPIRITRTWKATKAPGSRYGTTKAGNTYSPCQRVRQATERRHHRSSMHPARKRRRHRQWTKRRPFRAQSLHPGGIGTDLQRHAPRYQRMILVRTAKSTVLRISLTSWVTSHGKWCIFYEPIYDAYTELSSEANTSKNGAYIKILP